ncbi:TetR/AcrR family transcriptional regulator [Streptomyces sp. NBC_00344]|uniref:TetR/AcrR family transcriptional regulator n=1 Tax=Streptomyces sp. NBC_00344 TaxID=2975720 RepID=UPI002E1C2857
MSPRGVAIPDLRERLFDAAERVLVREGPGALTGRAITAEAGCAKGVLNAHFAGLDEFVAELVLDRFSRTASRTADLRSRAGLATVAGNLVSVALAVLNSLHPAIVGVAMTRPGASDRIRQALAAGAPGFTVIQDAITAYLDAEQRRGRLAAGGDTASMALALVGTLHHILMTSWNGAGDTREQAERLVAVLVGDGSGGAASAPDAP